MDTIGQITAAGLAALTAEARDYLEGGAGDEWTLRRNTAAFGEWTFRPRLLTGAATPDLRTTFLGVELDFPVLTGPVGADRLFHPDGQLAVARACAKAGIAAMAPEASSFALETLRGEAPEAVVFGQLHPVGSDADFLRMVERYERAGYRALVVTGDCPTAGWRERNLRNRYTPPAGVVGGNYPGEPDPFGRLFGNNQAWTWDRLGRLLARTELPWLAKGVLSAEDAHRALDAGAAAIGVSNHGGRQLDGTPAALDALPEVRAAVGAATPIAFDSGIRRGADVVKALALGADVVVLGRAAVYGLAADGEDGVAAVLRLLRDETRNILTQLGRGSVRDLDPTALRPLGATP
ncbi:alpha-hydroxy acid oxidase [Dactylosporangium sp. NPDC005572]|uniref:alpha-hydroxy acid oxidase n=1 Tax=Dactylosporangium sp. NPDC005572 TaxID=3156889 RepID=UPI0033ACC8CC